MFEDFWFVQAVYLFLPPAVITDTINTKLKIANTILAINCINLII